MGRTFRNFLQGNKVYGCRKCKTHLTKIERLQSKAFNGQHGRAYLFTDVVNVDEGEDDERQMTTGRHVVRDIFCNRCQTVLGWKYVQAYEPDQEYKVGCFILETALIDEVTTISVTTAEDDSTKSTDDLSLASSL